MAVVGASEDFGKFGGRVLHHLIKHRFRGRIVPVNPTRTDLFGLNVAPTIAQVGPVDVAVIALPADQLLPCIEDCVAAGVRAAVIITAQVREVGGEGAAREQRIVEIARAGGMRILGPNSPRARGTLTNDPYVERANWQRIAAYGLLRAFDCTGHEFEGNRRTPSYRAEVGEHLLLLRFCPESRGESF